LLQMISQVAHATIPNADFTTQTMMTFIFTAAMGVTSTLYRNPTIKWGAYVFGVISTVLTFGLIGFAWKKERLKMDPESLPARYELIALMCFTWTAFPLVFALSPESSGVLSQDSTIVIFAVLDLFCKNMYGYMSWYFNYCNAFSHRGTVLGIDRQNSLERLGRLEKRDKKKRKKKQDHDSDTTSPDTSDTDSEISSKDTDDNAKRRKPVDLEKANRSPRSVSAIDGTNGVDNSPSLALYPAARRPSAGGA